jgi:hypothetical protein
MKDNGRPAKEMGMHLSSLYRKTFIQKDGFGVFIDVDIRDH